MASKLQRWTVGSIVVVPLGDGFHSYAQMLEEPEYAFFDSRTRAELLAETVVDQPALFRLWVMNSAHVRQQIPGAIEKMANQPFSLIGVFARYQTHREGCPVWLIHHGHRDLTLR